MTTTTGPKRPTPIPPTTVPSTAKSMLDLEDLQAHYGIGKTKASDLVKDPSFLNSVVPGMHRYPAAAIEAYDLAVALAGTIADPARTAPVAPVVIAPPAKAKPGPKPGSKSMSASDRTVA